MSFKNLKSQQGLSLIELIAFIVIVGIIATTILIGMRNLILRTSTPNSLQQAYQLAQSRLEIILVQRKFVGFTNFTDPCSNATPPTVCTDLSSFATSTGLTVATPTIQSNGTGYKLITVSVSGKGSATVHARVSNYDNS